MRVNNSLLEKIQEEIKRPEGTLMMKSTIEWLFDASIGNRIVLQLVSGAQLFRVERDNKLNLKFYYSSPGTGTRVASIDLKKITPCQKVAWGFTWSPKKIKLFLGPQLKGEQLVFADGRDSKKKFRVVRGGFVVQLGDDGVEVMDTRFFVEGKPVLEPTAIDVWDNTLEAINILEEGNSSDSYMNKVVLCNIIISTLVSGFEVYCKTRFIELEKEGIKPNIEALIDRVFSQYELEEDMHKKLEQSAQSEGVSLLEKIAKEKVNFQNYNECKRAYNKAYDLKFGELEIDSNIFKDIKDFILFRHRIIHVSPLLGFLNQPYVPPEEPVFAGKDLLEKGKECFNIFIRKLHEKTLELRP